MLPASFRAGTMILTRGPTPGASAASNGRRRSSIGCRGGGPRLRSLHDLTGGRLVALHLVPHERGQHVTVPPPTREPHPRRGDLDIGSWTSCGYENVIGPEDIDEALQYLG